MTDVVPLALIGVSSHETRLQAPVTQGKDDNEMKLGKKDETREEKLNNLRARVSVTDLSFVWSQRRGEERKGRGREGRTGKRRWGEEALLC